MSTKGKLILVVEPLLSQVSTTQKTARAAGYRAVDLRWKPHNTVFRSLLAEFVWARRRVVVVSVMASQITALQLSPDRTGGMFIAEQRMLERLILGTGAVVLSAPHAPPHALRLPPETGGKPPMGGSAGATGVIVETPEGQIRGVKGKAPLGYPYSGVPPERDATIGLATLRRIGGLGVYPPSLPGLGAGHAAKALVVGARPNSEWGTRHPDLDWPFISADRSGCSAWLAERLEEDGVMERDLHWVDAYDARRKPISSNFLLDIQNVSIVVALGKEAATWCKDNGIVPREVHHPSFWKRFHPTHYYVLPKILKKGIL